MPWGPIFVKDLSRIGRDLDRVLIIDNVQENFMLQPYNGIFILTWYDDPHDTALSALTPLLEELVSRRPKVHELLDRYREQIPFWAGFDGLSPMGGECSEEELPYPNDAAGVPEAQAQETNRPSPCGAGPGVGGTSTAGSSGIATGGASASRPGAASTPCGGSVCHSGAATPCGGRGCMQAQASTPQPPAGSLPPSPLAPPSQRGLRPGAATGSYPGTQPQVTQHRPMQPQVQPPQVGQPQQPQRAMLIAQPQYHSSRPIASSTPGAPGGPPQQMFVTHRMAQQQAMAQQGAQAVASATAMAVAAMAGTMPGGVSPTPRPMPEATPLSAPRFGGISGPCQAPPPLHGHHPHQCRQAVHQHVPPQRHAAPAWGGGGGHAAGPVQVPRPS
mmetsp:Transcript_82006/g.228345  ORF Transcript_82006/g.228345 Transcript_82006/m.228345 type:complete len:388 (+) Transcript_82006:95-1258(+)